MHKNVCFNKSALPTGAVDTKTSNQIFSLLQRLNREMGLTILIVTHDMSIADKVSRTVMISDGKISTEKIRRGLVDTEKIRQGQVDTEKIRRGQVDTEKICWAEVGEEKAEEYSVLDKARRVQLTEDILEAAGITTNKVKVEVIDGKVVITGEQES